MTLRRLPTAPPVIGQLSGNDAAAPLGWGVGDRKLPDADEPGQVICNVGDSRAMPLDTGLMSLAITGLERCAAGRMPDGSPDGSRYLPNEGIRIPQPIRSRLLAAKSEYEAYAVVQPFLPVLQRGQKGVPSWLRAMDAFAFDEAGRSIEAIASAENFWNMLHNAALWQRSGELPFYCRRPNADQSKILPERWIAWRVVPYGVWEEAGGSLVVFDRCYRPVARRREDGAVRTVPSDERIHFVSEKWLWCGASSPRFCRASRERVAQIICEWKLGEELDRRCRIETLAARRRGSPLPRWDHRG